MTEKRPPEAWEAIHAVLKQHRVLLDPDTPTWCHAVGCGWEGQPEEFPTHIADLLTPHVLAISKLAKEKAFRDFALELAALHWMPHLLPGATAAAHEADKRGRP